MQRLLESSKFSSIKLEAMEPSKNLFELDLSLWVFYRGIAQVDAVIASKHLGIGPEVAAKLAAVNDIKLSLLGSGVLLSFTLFADRSALIATINEVASSKEIRLAELLSPSNQLSRSLDSICYERYWRVMRDQAITSGVKTTSLVFNVDQEIVRKVSKLSDGEILKLSSVCRIGFRLRFEGDVVCQIITEPNITHYNLLRYQQALSRTDITSKKERNPSLGELEDQPKPGALKSYSPQWIKAKHLASIGFTARALQIETGITQKQVVRLRGEIREVGIDLPNTAAKLRNGSLVRDYVSSIQASLVMLCYHRFGGKSLSQNINIDALVSAFIIYHKIRNETDMNPHRWKIIDPNAGYSLARELRGNGIEAQAYFEECDHCSTLIFISTNQQIKQEERCPFCRIKDAKRIKAA